MTILAASMSGCSILLGHERSSPGQNALGVRLVPEIYTSESGVALHAVGGFQRQFFDGGHDHVFTGGLQVRRVIGTGDRAPWIGGEASYNDWRYSPDDSGEGDNATEVATVWGLGGLVGLPVTDNGIAVWSMLQILLFGDFDADGYTVPDSGGSGWQISFGIEIPRSVLQRR